MSDQSQGPGWWQASDSKWYPPSQHPDENYRQQYTPPPAPPAPATRVGGYEYAPPAGPPPDPRAEAAAAKARYKATRPWWKKKRFWLTGLLLAGIVGCSAIVAAGVSEGTKDEDNNNVPDILEDNGDPEDMSLSEFNQIENGMTYEQVVAIVGSEGTLSSDSEIANYKTSLYTWPGNGAVGANANVTFQNGKVVSKAQFGLTNP